MTLNVYSYSEEVKKSILQRRVAIDDISFQPLDWAWLTYALSQDEIDNNPLFKESLTKLVGWAFSEAAGLKERNLAPLGLCVHFMQEDEQRQSLIHDIRYRLKKHLLKEVEKFSLLNDPEQIFCIVLGASHDLPENQREALRDIAKRYITTGQHTRQVLFAASILELGYQCDILPALNEKITNPEDIVSILWFYERYKERCEQCMNLDSPWNTFENIKDTIALEDVQEQDENMIFISNRAIAMLYEAVRKQTQKPDPCMLYDSYRLHKRVCDVSESLFKKGEYLNAVFEATKSLEAFIKDKTGINKSGRSLAQEAMRENQPMIAFNELKTQSEKDEQVGLKLITEGIFAAFRNPKGHEPKNTSWGAITPYEALDQLIMISYIFGRIEPVKVVKKDGDKNE